uniref:phosphatidate phosphatase n=1 Tax=Xiphophorus couchianus TaxID=32473 RepID=A0A3B5MJ29_9TELE
MNIVGQLAETVFVTVKELYRGLNPATLTGGIDVIVVRQPDGSYQCSPFHIRFGKLGVLRSKEKIVDIEINGESVDLHMKLGDNGEAFFVEEEENMDVPAFLCTSPIPLEVPEETDVISEGSGARKKKRWRKHVRYDNQQRDEANSSSEERDKDEESMRDSDAAQWESLSSQPLLTRSDSETYRFLRISCVFASVFLSRPDSPKIDSEVLDEAQDLSEPQMQWNWGGFPTVKHTNTDRAAHLRQTCAANTPGELKASTHFFPIERQDSFDLDYEVTPSVISCVKPQPKAGSFCLDSSSQQASSLSTKNNVHDALSYRSDHFMSCVSSVDVDSECTVEEKEKKDSSSESIGICKQNHHGGSSDIYLDDLTALDPEVAELYFPKVEAEGALTQYAEQGSGSQSPQSVDIGAVDSGTEYLSDSTSYVMDVSMSLCGKVGDTSQITKEKFTEHLVTYQDFINNPGIIQDPSLVICINSNYYNWGVAAPMILSMTAFQKHLPTSTVEQLVKDKMSKKPGRWWFSWRRREMDNNKVVAQVFIADNASSLFSEAMSMTQSFSHMYRKSLRLTSKEIESLNLRDGANKVVFSVTTQYQGTCRCEAAIYLWNWNDRVIISDIDGTITKSDALGHILPQFGKDWTHKGIAKLYHKIHKNGYKFLYCSARAIGMAGITKDYLRWVNEQGTVLPKGPVLLAPSSLFSALHREVIEKKPEVFKVACLSDIRDLFGSHKQPFYAAFGNRTNDVFAYKQVGVTESKIFTVNPKGELIQELSRGSKSSYNHLTGLVEHFFPMVAAETNNAAILVCPEYSSFSYWKEPLPEVDISILT